MKAALLRTGSAPVHSWIGAGSGNFAPSARQPAAGSLKKLARFPIASLTAGNIRRSSSAVSLVLSGTGSPGEFPTRLGGAGSRSFPAKIPEEEYVVEERGDDCDFDGFWREIGVRSGGGGKGCGGGGSLGRGGDGGRSKEVVVAYYEKMVKSNPGDFLLLRNYAKFLHEVENDGVRAEEYYGRAILASPGDGEVLSLYAALVWEKDGDARRAKSYFDRAVHVAPDDCMVMGSYARFMWEAEEGNDDDALDIEAAPPPAPPPAVAAF